MKSGRRSFLTGASAGLLALDRFPGLLSSQPVKPSDMPARDVLDFWVNRVGVPADLIVGGKSSSGSVSGDVAFDRQGSFEATYGSEPLFLYSDDEEGILMPAQQIPVRRMHDSGDSIVEMKVGRLRLSSQDETRFDRYTTTGVYFEMQQKQPPPSSVMSLGWSLFGAMFPKLNPGGAKKPALLPAANPQGSQLQAIALPGGNGKVMFNCFLKDQRKSVFGKFLSVFMDLGMQGAAAFMPMLHMPGMVDPALNSVRALVARLQGNEQHWLFQNSPLDVCCNSQQAAQSESLRLRSGHYVVIPKAHGSMFQKSMKDTKILDGFVVPKEASLMDVYEAAPVTAAGVSYLTVQVKVTKAQLNTCLMTAPRA